MKGWGVFDIGPVRNKIEGRIKYERGEKRGVLTERLVGMEFTEPT